MKITIYFIYFGETNEFFLNNIYLYGDWGLGIGDWGMGIEPKYQIPKTHPKKTLPIY